MSQTKKIDQKDPIMVVDDDLYLLSAIKQTLILNGYEVQTFNIPNQALAAIKQQKYAAVVTDIKMPQMSGIELFEQIKTFDAELPVILITGHGDVEMAVKAMKEGVYDFLQKPVDENALTASIERAVEKRRLVMANRDLSCLLKKQQRRRSCFYGLIGNHPLMLKLFDIIEVVAKEEDPVMLYGETGTGKELVARAIHESADKAGKPFVAVNMGAMPTEMIESELFGHEKGAFTGATHRKKGKFEYAADGTLFLDEICSMSIDLQVKLLRVLEEKSVTPLGSNLAVPIKARIVAATNKKLEEEVAGGTFRQDLFYRLNVLPVNIPPLRERKEDIPLLVEYFRLENCDNRKKNIETFSKELLEQLQEKKWPGNTRELKNFVRRICVFGDHDCSEIITKPKTNAVEVSSLQQTPLKKFIEQMEKEYIEKVLRKNKGLVPLTHEKLGISRKSLYDKVNKYSIDLKSFRRKNKKKL